MASVQVILHWKPCLARAHNYISHFGPVSTNAWLVPSPLTGKEIILTVGRVGKRVESYLSGRHTDTGTYVATHTSCPEPNKTGPVYRPD